MTTLVFLLEEPSAREMLQGLLPGLLPREIEIKYIVFQGKQDLEKNVVRKLRGWLKPHSLFVIMRDQDASDCNEVKQKLVEMCRDAGKQEVLIRIACRELESFYLGDLCAVQEGLGLKGLSSRQNKRKYRNPDDLGNPSEELMKLTGGVYEKVAGSRAIGQYLDISNNQSHSFKVLINGIKRIVEG